MHRIADALQAIQRRNFYQLRADANQRGRGCHEHSMSIAVERDSPTNQQMSADAEDTMVELLRDLARWLYRQLESEYEYQTSNEVTDEAINVNDYTFTEDGRRVWLSGCAEGRTWVRLRGCPRWLPERPPESERESGKGLNRAGRERARLSGFIPQPRSP